MRKKATVVIFKVSALHHISIAAEGEARLRLSCLCSFSAAVCVGDIFGCDLDELVKHLYLCMCV